MRQKIRIIILAAVSGLNICSLLGQEAVSASGSDASGSTGSISYTVGQTAVSTISGTNGSVVQGVQQPYEISVITAAENTQEITLHCIVYPNPTRSDIKLSIEYDDFENMFCRLYDINGTLLRDLKIENEETVIPMQNLVPSAYILKVIRNKRELKTFKIIKN